MSLWKKQIIFVLKQQISINLVIENQFHFKKGKHLTSFTAGNMSAQCA
jgi:hypothetical protein